jgi:nitrogen fixation protein FixH
MMGRGLFLSMMLGATLLLAQDSGWKIALEPQGDLSAAKPVPVHVNIKDAKGAAVSGAHVELVLTMVDMDHGETKVAAKQVKPGVYEARPKFMMEGKWNVEVRAKKGSAESTIKQQVEVDE